MEDAPATGNSRAAVNCRSLVPFQNSSLSSSRPCASLPLPPSPLPPRLCPFYAPRTLGAASATNVRSRANFRAWLACREYRHGPSEILARRGATGKLNRPRLSAAGHCLPKYRIPRLPPRHADSFHEGIRERLILMSGDNGL